MGGCGGGSGMGGCGGGRGWGGGSGGSGCGSRSEGREGGSGKSGTDAIVAVTTVSRRTVLFRHGRDDPREQGALIAGSGIERPAREIETAGVPGVAAERGTPLRAMRSIGDTVEEPLPSPSRSRSTRKDAFGPAAIYTLFTNLLPSHDNPGNQPR